MSSGHVAKLGRTRRKRGHRGGDGDDGDGRDSLPTKPFGIREINIICAINEANGGVNYVNHLLRRLPEEDRDATSLMVLSQEIAGAISRALEEGPAYQKFPASWEELFERFDAGAEDLKESLRAQYTQMTDDSIEGFEQIYRDICQELIRAAASDKEIGRAAPLRH
jgi:hypothetical protein